MDRIRGTTTATRSRGSEMAFEQRIIWTALPNGVGQDSAGDPVLFLTVHVAPRLTTTGAADATLASFPDWTNWPGHAQSFAVQLEILAPGPGTGTYALSAAINPD